MSSLHLGINLGHNRSAALVRDGEIVVAIGQERLDHIKHSIGVLHQSLDDLSHIQLPYQAINYCLESERVKLSDLSSITGNMPGVDYSPLILNQTSFGSSLESVKTIPSHHLAHAYSAFWPSGFDEALVLVMDGSGSTNEQHQTESYTFYHGCGKELKLLHSEKVSAHLSGLSTLGFIYEYISRKAGFITHVGHTIAVPEAGKLMGLAPFGGDQENWCNWIKHIPGSYSLDISAYDIFLEVAALEKRYDDGKGKPYLRHYLIDLAYKVQQELECALLNIVEVAVNETGLRRLCLAGGVALNSVANYVLYKRLNLEDVFVFPAAGDDGIAAGCALWAYANFDTDSRRRELFSASLGQRYSAASIEQAIEAQEGVIQAEKMTEGEALKRCAEALAQGHVVARFEGGAEFGPRALGNRSILADPTLPKIKDILNARVKFREAFRPFAPVVPEECAVEYFDLEQPVKAARMMLLIANIRTQYQSALPGVCHHDGTGRLQTVTEAHNPFFYRLCKQIAEERSGPPVLLNTSFNVAGQPIVETPQEAIETFLGTDIDYLLIENVWITKKDVPVKCYEEHVASLAAEETLPEGMSPGQAGVSDLMKRLHRALFFQEYEGCPWSLAELETLSAQGGHYVETSQVFSDAEGIAMKTSKLSNDHIALIDPLNLSKIVNLKTSDTLLLDYSELKWFYAVLQGSDDELENLRVQEQLTTKERTERVLQSSNRIRRLGLQVRHHDTGLSMADSSLTAYGEDTFYPFNDEDYYAGNQLSDIHAVFVKYGYEKATICSKLSVDSLQRIEPTHLQYYADYRLEGDTLSDLVRLFLLRAELSKARIESIFGEQAFTYMSRIGLIISRGEGYVSRIDIFPIDGLYIATDHRYMLLEEDTLHESPVMYIGLDSAGLANASPRLFTENALDLCTGSGIQALVASRYSKHVTGVDLNPRAIRFSRFNAQLNGITNVKFVLGDLYHSISGMYDLILANPPFVASPHEDLKFRDGGAQGEEVLSRIITQASQYLTDNGRMSIVTDLVDVHHYQQKLDHWWQGGDADKLVLHTADRDDILFAVPHSHAPFGQSFEAYNRELKRWVDHFHRIGLGSVNFGYIFIKKNQSGQESYFSRVIYSPEVPIYDDVLHYFVQRSRLACFESGTETYFLQFSPKLRFSIESEAEKVYSITIYHPDNPYYTKYKISELIYDQVQFIIKQRPSIREFINESNDKWLKDLLNKGIIRLSTFQDSADDVHNESDLSNDVSGLWVNELSTKTTPTCLTNYLLQ